MVEVDSGVKRRRIFTRLGTFYTAQGVNPCAFLGMKIKEVSQVIDSCFSVHIRFQKGQFAKLVEKCPISVKEAQFFLAPSEGVFFVVQSLPLDEMGSPCYLIVAMGREKDYWRAPNAEVELWTVYTEYYRHFVRDSEIKDPILYCPNGFFIPKRLIDEWWEGYLTWGEINGFEILVKKEVFLQKPCVLLQGHYYWKGYYITYPKGPRENLWVTVEDPVDCSGDVQFVFAEGKIFRMDQDDRFLGEVRLPQNHRAKISFHALDRFKQKVLKDPQAVVQFLQHDRVRKPSKMRWEDFLFTLSMLLNRSKKVERKNDIMQRIRYDQNATYWFTQFWKDKVVGGVGWIFVINERDILVTCYPKEMGDLYSYV